MRLYVGASLSGDGVWPEVPRSFTDAETAALAAAARAETAAQTAQEILSDCASERDLEELELWLYNVERNTDTHIDDTAIHITAAERAAWNAKVDAEQYRHDLEEAGALIRSISAELDYKADDTALEQHAGDAQVHVTAAERAAWNAAAGNAQTLEPILTCTTDGTGGSASVYLTTDDDGAPFALRLAVVRLSLLQSPTANGNFGVYLGSANSFYVAKFTLSATTGMNANYSALLRASQELGFWVSEQTPMANNGYGQVYRSALHTFAYPTADYPAITSVRLVGTPSAPLRLELFGVRA